MSRLGRVTSLAGDVSRGGEWSAELAFGVAVWQTGSLPAHDLESPRTFRTDLHGCFPRRADALFELGDALLAVESVGLLPHLSLQAPYRLG